MRSVPGRFLCAFCRGHRPSEAQALEREDYCEWCGTWHGSRQACQARAERAAMDVRLWLAGMTREDVADADAEPEG